MSPELFLAFVLATMLFIAIPGPNVTLIVAHGVEHGSRRALATVIGTECAQAVQLAFVALGMTTLIFTFAQVFEWVRWLGVAYLVWLGIQRWRTVAPESGVAVPDLMPVRVLFWRGFLMGISNPKTWLFYAAFFPQFVNPATSVGPQLLLLSLTYLTVAMAIDGGYAVLAGRARGWLRIRGRRRVADRVTGGLLIGAGVWLALARRG